MCRLTGSRGMARDESGEGEMSLPVDPTIPRHTPVPDFRAKRNERRTCGAARVAPDGKKKKKEPGFTSRSRANERDDRGVRGRVQIVFGGQGRESIYFLPCVYSTFSLFSHLSSSLFQTLPDVTRRLSDEVIVRGCGKKN